ncbi:hypothetical protein VNO77_40534 [Canavalia gladiata]|uniref:Uncharacterized protein n=1 Tax=Canavalia gladiata TaxID=3824 RepID=A0AAN9JY14_CANGL
MIDQPETVEQRIEKLEGSVGEILGLLKQLTQMDANHKNLYNIDTNSEEGSQVDEEEAPKVVIVTPNNYEKVNEEDAKMLSKMEILEENVRVMQGMEAYASLYM